MVESGLDCLNRRGHFAEFGIDNHCDRVRDVCVVGSLYLFELCIDYVFDFFAADNSRLC